MKNAIHGLLVLGVGILGYLARDLVLQGVKLHRAETAARQDVVALMAAEDQAYDPERETPYQSLHALLEEGTVQGFEPIAGTPGNGEPVIFRKGRYLFRVQLLPPGSGDRGELKIGSRYELWAWPLDEQDLSSVVFWASNAGFLLQGENGMAAGPKRPPAMDVNPLRELTRETADIEAGFRETTRWLNFDRPSIDDQK